jgi:hypothetical protein
MSRPLPTATPRWQSPGPVSTAFVDSNAAVTVLMGPAGGGKTVTGLQKGVLKAFCMPEVEPGVRRVRFLVLRQQMTDLEGSTLPSWFRWYPRGMGRFTGKDGSPKVHAFTLAHPRGGRVEFEAHFRGIGDRDIDDALRGFEFSFAYNDECDLMPADTLATLIKRAGRFPAETLARNPKWAWGTCNAPEPDSWVVTDLIDGQRENWQLFRQPSGLSPQAENLAVLGPDWYRAQAAVLPAYERKRFIENIPGITRGAAVVYESFNPDWHVAEAPLAVLPGRPLTIGMDAGGTPAAVLLQEGADGQLRILAELSTHQKLDGSVTGPTRFGEALLRILAEPRFDAVRARTHGIADPSAAFGADRANGEGSWVEIVSRTANLPVRPAPTNDPTVRGEALRLPMSRLIEGRRPGLLLDPSCRLLARALSRDYAYPLVNGRRGDVPRKNWASHIVEAAQYGALDGGAYHQILARQQAFHRPAGPQLARTGFNPFQQQRGAR